LFCFVLYGLETCHAIFKNEHKIFIWPCEKSIDMKTGKAQWRSFRISALRQYYLSYSDKILEDEMSGTCRSCKGERNSYCLVKKSPRRGVWDLGIDAEVTFSGVQGVNCTEDDHLKRLWTSRVLFNMQFLHKVNSHKLLKKGFPNSYRKSNKMPHCIKILFHIYMKLNMFRATHRPSSGA